MANYEALKSSLNKNGEVMIRLDEEKKYNYIYTM